MILLKMVRTVPAGAISSKRPSRSPDSPRGVRYSHAGMLAGGALVLALILAILLAASRPDGSATSVSIAMLPFENWSGAGTDQPFVEGVYDQIMAELGRIDEVRIISRMSAERFRDAEVSLPAMGEALDVDYIITGSVLRRRTQYVRICACTTPTRTSRCGRRPTIGKTVGNILDVQREVAGRVAAELDATIGPGDTQQRKPDGPANLTALDLYHDGMFYLRRIETDPLAPDEVFDNAVERFRGLHRGGSQLGAAPRCPWAGLHFGGHGDEAKLYKSKTHVLEAFIASTTSWRSRTNPWVTFAIDGSATSTARWKPMAAHAPSTAE